MNEKEQLENLVQYYREVNNGKDEEIEELQKQLNALESRDPFSKLETFMIISIIILSIETIKTLWDKLL